MTACGRRQGENLTGRPRWGPVALSAFGAAHLIEVIVVVAAADTVPIASFLLVLVQVFAPAAGLLAAAAAYRSEVADRSTRVLLVVVVVVLTVFTVDTFLPSAAAFAVATPLYVLFSFSLIAFGCSLVLDGRHDRVRRRVKLLRERW